MQSKGAINESQFTHKENESLNLPSNIQFLNVGDMSLDPEYKSILPSQSQVIDKKAKQQLIKNSMQQAYFLDNLQQFDDVQLLEISLGAKIDTFLGIEKIIQVEGFKATYSCQSCSTVTDFDEKSKCIECQCSNIKLRMKDKFVPITKPNTSKKLSELTFNDLSILYQFQAQTYGQVKFQHLKLLIKCKKCAENSVEILDLSVIIQAPTIPQIKQLNFNFQAMCNKCCSIQYLGITHLEVNYKKVE